MTKLSKLFHAAVFGALAFCAVGLVGISQASAQYVCPAVPHWSATVPPVNNQHVFCGEVRANGTAAGFHSRPGGVNPASVAGFVITDRPNSLGVYGGTVTLVNPNGANPQKNSTMFPDSCTAAEVQASILHAVANQQLGGCTVGAGNWTCGKNRPANGDGAGFCIGDSPGSRFYIAFHELPHGHVNAGNINTAFPLR